MGGGGGDSQTSQNVNNNQSYVYQGGSINLSNLFGSLSYKGGNIETSQSSSFNPSVSNSNKQDATQDGGGGGSGGGMDLNASVGVGLGGGTGSAGPATKTGGGFGGNSTGSANTGNIPTPVVYGLIGLGAVFVISKVVTKSNKRKK